MSTLSDEAKRRLALLETDGPDAGAEARVRAGVEQALGVALPVASLAGLAANAGGAAAAGGLSSGGATGAGLSTGAAASGVAASGVAASGVAVAGAAATSTLAAGATTSGASGWLLAMLAGALVTGGAGVGYVVLGGESAPARDVPSVVAMTPTTASTPPATAAVPAPSDPEPPAALSPTSPEIEPTPAPTDPAPAVASPTNPAPAIAARRPTAPAPAPAPALREDAAPAPTEVPPPPPAEPETASPTPVEEAQQLDPELACDGDAELRFAQAAERHLEAANAAHALALLDAFGRRCPSGHWSELTWAVRLGSLCTLGRAREASQLVAWHREEHPRSTPALLERTRRWCTPTPE